MLTRRGFLLKFLLSEWKMLLFSIVMTVLMINLAFWQIDRFNEKRHLESKLASQWQKPILDLAINPLSTSFEPSHSSSLLYRRIQICGEYLNDAMVFLDNRTYQGVAGYFVFTSLQQCSTNKRLLILRGWVPRLNGTLELPTIEPIYGKVHLSGRLVPPQQPSWLIKGVELGENSPEWPLRIQSLTQRDIETLYVNESGQAFITSFYVHLDESQPGSLQWVDIKPATSSEKHRGYAIQWFAMTTALIVLLFYRLRTSWKTSEKTISKEGQVNE